MSEFKPTAPGWYWADTKQMHRVSNIINIKTGKLFLAVEILDEFGDPDYLPLEEFTFLAPVVPLEDGPGINAIQRQCLETALVTSNTGYCVLGLVDESIEALAEYWHGLTDEQRRSVDARLRGNIQTVLMLGADISRAKKAIRACELPALPEPSDEAKGKIWKEGTDAIWYLNVLFDRCGAKAADAYQWLKGKLSKRAQAGTLAATTKREGES